MRFRVGVGGQIWGGGGCLHVRSVVDADMRHAHLFNGSSLFMFYSEFTSAADVD